VNESELLDRLNVRVGDVEADVARLADELTDVAAALGTTGTADLPSEPMYESLDEWVREYFAPTFGRPLGGEHRWCGRWQEHAEAAGRLEALWRSWEVLRLDPGLGMATWFVNHLDPQLNRLLDRQGPFGQCSPDRHGEQSPLPE
jgi:hypothetical protein